MLVAHLVPGYFAAVKTLQIWGSDWNPTQKTLAWSVALGSTFAPDLDVIRNFLFRGFFNHSILWTHSIFVYLSFGLLWLICRTSKRFAYFAILTGLIAVGGLSHLFLDIITHGTPFLYPLSMAGFGIAPQRVVEGGVWAYLTDPIFLLEPLTIGIAVCHWLYHRKSLSARTQRLSSIIVVLGVLVFMVVFMTFLPVLQRVVLPLLPV